MGHTPKSVFLFVSGNKNPATRRSFSPKKPKIRHRWHIKNKTQQPGRVFVTSYKGLCSWLPTSLLTTTRLCLQIANWSASCQLGFLNLLCLPSLQSISCRFPFGLFCFTKPKLLKFSCTIHVSSSMSFLPSVL